MVLDRQVFLTLANNCTRSENAVAPVAQEDNRLKGIDAPGGFNPEASFNPAQAPQTTGGFNPEAMTLLNRWKILKEQQCFTITSGDSRKAAALPNH